MTQSLCWPGRAEGLIRLERVRYQKTTGYSIKKIIQTLRRIHTVVIDLNGHQLTARTPLDQNSLAILDALKSRH